MHMIRPENTVAEITFIYSGASTYPCRVKTLAGSEWVMKLKGAGPGPVGLLTEFIALRIASAMGLNVPVVEPLYLPHGFPWMLGTDEFDGIVQRSFGWNLGTAFIEDTILATAEEVQGSGAEFREKLAQADRFLANTDRSARNTNVLALPSSDLVAIDFDASLFLRRAARGIIPDSFPLWPDHLLYDLVARTQSQPLPLAVLTEAIDDAPDEWIEVMGVGRDMLKSGLIDYATAWSNAD